MSCSRMWDNDNTEKQSQYIMGQYYLYYINNKAIRDGKCLARHMLVLGNVHPIKIENVDIFFVTSFLCSLELLYY